MSKGRSCDVQFLHEVLSETEAVRHDKLARRYLPIQGKPWFNEEDVKSIVDVDCICRYPSQGAWVRALIECGGLEPPAMGLVPEDGGE